MRSVRENGQAFEITRLKNRFQHFDGALCKRVSLLFICLIQKMDRHFAEVFLSPAVMQRIEAVAYAQRWRNNIHRPEFGACRSRLFKKLPFDVIDHNRMRPRQQLGYSEEPLSPSG